MDRGAWWAAVHVVTIESDRQSLLVTEQQQRIPSTNNLGIYIRFRLIQGDETWATTFKLP